MATTKDAEWQESTANADNWGTEVEAESQIVLEREGEGFIAILDGIDPANASGIIQIHLTDVTDLNGVFLGENMFINGTRDLVQKLRKVPAKSQIRCEWVSSMNTGQSTPMRVFRVQHR